MSEDMNSPLWSFVFSKGRQRQKDMTAILSSVPLFESLSRRELRAISDIVHQRTYEENEFIFRKGQTGAAMFVITSGKVNITDHDPEKDQNIIAALGENAFFCELALLDDSPRSASALATTTTEIFAFFRTELDRLFSTAPQIGYQVYRSLAVIIGTRLKATNEHLFDK